MKLGNWIEILALDHVFLASSFDPLVIRSMPEYLGIAFTIVYVIPLELDEKVIVLIDTT
jgi:hypothetical protein